MSALANWKRTQDVVPLRSSSRLQRAGDVVNNMSTPTQGCQHLGRQPFEFIQKQIVLINIIKNVKVNDMCLGCAVYNNSAAGDPAVISWCTVALKALTEEQPQILQNGGTILTTSKATTHGYVRELFIRGSGFLVE